jgi:hypothetical protein
VNDPRALLAAANNADLYAAMFAAHGEAFTRHDFAFESHGTAPPYYSDVTVQTPGHASDVGEMIARALRRTNRATSAKDSFCELDSVALGMRVLFEASWIWRAPQPSAMPQGWVRIETATHLAAWEAAWKASGSPTDEAMFPPTLLNRADIAFFAKGEDVQAGCLANLSEGCVGLSNVFAKTGDALHEAADVVAHFAPELPSVGYESGASLQSAHDCGFTSTGDLRILVPERE